jgi:urease accessory protein
MRPSKIPDRRACTGPAPFRSNGAGLTAGVSVACRWLAAAGALLPLTAQAHGWNGGHSPVFSGFMHVITNPAFILPLAALALLASRGGRRWLLLCQWLIGAGVALGAGAAGAGYAWHGVVIANRVFIILAGLPVAAALPVPGAVVPGIVLVGAMLTGHELLITDPPAGHALLFGCGAVLGAMALHGAVGVATLLSDAAWTRVAVRVAGSWITAIGVIYAGLLFLPHK